MRLPFNKANSFENEFLKNLFERNHKKALTDVIFLIMLFTIHY